MLRITLLSLVLSCVSSLCVAWDLDANHSVLNFISIKKDTIGELHHFKKFSGQIDAGGKAQLSIALDSVDTAIAIRDERLRQFLFETAKFPNALYAVNVKPVLLGKLQPGAPRTVTLDGMLTLHGKTLNMPAKVSVLKTRSGQLRISTVQPILLNADQFGMTAGVTKLAELAGLPAISSVVPVTFVLTFVEPPQAASGQ